MGCDTFVLVATVPVYTKCSYTHSLQPSEEICSSALG